MSSDSRQFLTPADLSMLDRVLVRAGFRNLDDTAEREARLGAARRLIASFQGGMTNEASLFSSLAGEPAAEDVTVASIGYDIAARIFSERSLERTNPSPTRGGYQYGKRVELDGSWTIYHVFTGVPAQFGAWEMVRMDKGTAKRALRTLNTPERDQSIAPAQKHRRM